MEVPTYVFRSKVLFFHMPNHVRTKTASHEIHSLYTTTTILTLTVSGQNVHAREFKLRLGFSSYDEQVTRNWHRQ